MSDDDRTYGKFPVPAGQMCQWPDCEKKANGSVAVGAQGTDRLWLCIDHIDEAGRIADEAGKSQPEG